MDCCTHPCGLIGENTSRRGRGPSGGVAGFRYTSVAGSRDHNANASTSGASNPFGAVSVDSEQMSLYATCSRH